MSGLSASMWSGAGSSPLSSTLMRVGAYAIPLWQIAIAAAAVAVVFVIWRARRALARAAAADADFGGVYELDPDFAKLVAMNSAEDKAPPALLAIGPLGAGRAAVILDASAAEPAEGRLVFEPESSVGRLARAYKVSAASAPLGRARVTGGGLPARVSCELRDRGRLLLLYTTSAKKEKRELHAMYVRNCVVSSAFA